MRRLDRIEDQMRGTVTFELANGQFASFDARAVEEYGIAKLLESIDAGDQMPTERVPVIRNGRRIGTMPPDFDPASARIYSFMYDVRSGDFRREGDAWIVDRSLGAGDVDCVVGFIRDTPAVSNGARGTEEK